MNRTMGVFFSFWAVSSSLAFAQDPLALGAPDQWSEIDIAALWKPAVGGLATLGASTSVEGGAQYSLPIPLPKARYSPQLSISYVGVRSHDLYLGRGWQLDVPALRRIANPTAPYFEELSSPDGPLIGAGPVRRPTADLIGNARTYTELSNADKIEATGKSGERWMYSALAGTADRYVITKQTGRFGDEVRYHYNPDGLLERISYGALEGTPGEIVVTFTYRDDGWQFNSRCSGRSDWSHGVEVSYDTTLVGLTVTVDANTVEQVDFSYSGTCSDRLEGVQQTTYAGVLAESRRWTFGYADGSWRSEVFPSPPALGISYGNDTGLGEIETTRGIGSLNSDPLPDLIGDIDYHATYSDDNGHRFQGDGPGTTAPELSFTAKPIRYGSSGSTSFWQRVEETRHVDVDGDGFMDELDGAQGLPTTTQGFADSIQTFHDPVAHSSTTIQTVDLLDWDGDGDLDLVEANSGVGERPGLQVYLYSPGHGGWGSAALSVEAPWCPGQRLSFPDVSATDPDSLAGGARTWGLCWIRRADSDAEVWNQANFDTEVRTRQVAGFTDLNGDGLPDFVEVRGDHWEVWENDGRGGWANSRSWRGSPDSMGATYSVRTEVPFQPSSSDGELGLGDIDGDGLIDVIDALEGGWYRNLGSGFDWVPGAPVRVGGGRTIDDYSRMVGGTRTDITAALGDWDGDGTTDLLDAETGSLWSWGGPAVLTSVSAYDGPSTYPVFSYPTRQVTFDWRGTGEIAPSGNWNGDDVGMHLPFPVVVGVTEIAFGTFPSATSVRSIDISHVGGVWSPTCRRFLGFAEEYRMDSEGRTEHTVRDLTCAWQTTRLVTWGENADKGDTTIRATTSREITNPSGTAPFKYLPTCETVTESRYTPYGPSSTTRAIRRKFDQNGNAYSTIVGTSCGAPGIGDVQVEVDWNTGTNGVTLPIGILVHDASPNRLGLVATYSDRRLEYDGLAWGQVGAGALTAVEAERFGESQANETRRWEIDRNSHGQVTATVSPGGALTTYSYDRLSRFVSRVTNAVGQATERSEDVWGRETFSTDVARVSAFHTYDARGRETATERQAFQGNRETVARTTYEDGVSTKITQRTYGAPGIEDAVEIALQDGWGQTFAQGMKSGPSAWLYTEREFDSGGRTTRETVPREVAWSDFTGYHPTWPGTTRTFDNVGAWAHTRDPLGADQIDVTEDPDLHVVQDATGRQTWSQRDAFGRVVASWSEHNGVAMLQTTYEYDGIGRLVAATDPDGVLTTWSWSSLNELLYVQSTDIGWKRFFYDADGNIETTLDSRGRGNHWVRDDLGRVEEVWSAHRNPRDPDSPLFLFKVETWTWDTLVPGRITSVVDTVGSVLFGYDSYGRMNQETRTWPDGKVTTRRLAYDLQDRVVEETNPDGVMQRYQYQYGRLEKVVVAPSSLWTLPVDVVYAPDGRVSGFRLTSVGNIDTAKMALSRTETRDLVGRVQRLDYSLTNAAGAVVSWRHRYGYELNGLVKDRAIGSPTKTLPTTGDASFTYDPASRLRSATGRGASTWTVSDGGLADTRTGLEEKTYVGGSTATDVATHRIEAVSDASGRWEYTYDSAGNVEKRVRHLNTNPTVAAETVTFTYDGRGRPLTADGGTAGKLVRKYAYNGTVAWEELNGVVIRRQGSWEEVGGEGRTLLSVGGIPYGAVKPQSGKAGAFSKQLEVWFSDLQGTPVAVYAGASGTRTSWTNVDVYGAEVTAGTGTADVAHGWLGVPRLKSLGLVLTGVRLFDEPSRGFLSPEPMLLGASGPGFAMDPYNLNPYAYARWDGAGLMDPSGLCAVDDVSDCFEQLGAMVAEVAEPVMATVASWGQPLRDEYDAMIYGAVGGLVETIDAAGTNVPMPPVERTQGELKQAGGTLALTVASLSGAGLGTGELMGASGGGNRLLTNVGSGRFAGDQAVVHFERHSGEVMSALGRSSYNLEEYVADANFVIRSGTWVPEMNGYTQIIGGHGSAKAAFVGLDRATGDITTFHIKTVSELSKKAPSLGWSK